MLKQGIIDRPYNGVVDCTKRVFQQEGLFHFWRGNLANVLRYFPTQALNFASGGTAGTMSLLFVYSLDYARTRLANDAKKGERQFNGLVDVYVKTFKTDGIQGLYRGFVISAVGIFVYRG